MRYISESDLPKAKAAGFDPDAVGSIHRSGSVAGMQKKYGWPRGGQIRIGSYIYNAGPDMVRRLSELGIVRD